MPDAIPSRAESRPQRGRLKVFLGAAPGVGKTYAMLRAAQRRRADGIDVVVGLVETHGRSETAELVAGLEVLPRRTVAYRGRDLAELDLDAALARRPALLLVDELAHTNAPDSRHPKRYMDVEELLAAGIDVYTTLNIQHLESLNDVVARITRIRVRETLPDRVFDRADEIELIDLSPEELTKRLAEGKVYVPEQAQRAARHFFQPGNITALRELALRRAAERVDDQMLDYMRQNAIRGPWPASERLLVCIGPSNDAQLLVRETRLMAERLHAPWSAVYVEMPWHDRLDDAARARIAQALRLTEHLGGEAVTLPARDLPGELLDYARRHNVTRLVVGKSRKARFREWLGRSLLHELVRRADSIAIHVVTMGSDVPVRPAPARTGFAAGPLRAYLLAAGAVAAATATAEILSWLTDFPNLAMVFLLAVVVSAAGLGAWPAIFASVLSAAAYNFLFIDPLYSLTIAQPHEFLAFLVFLVVSIVTGQLAGRVRDQIESTRRRARTNAALYDFSRKMSATASLDDLLWAFAFQISTALGADALVLLGRAGQLELKMAYPPEDSIGPGEWTAARWAFDKGEAAGHGSDTLPTIGWSFHPMRTAGGIVGVVGLRRPPDAGLLEPEARRLLEALVDQAAVAIERTRLEEEMGESRLAAETEKLRGALLASISHDLRTPLASIIGAVSSLRSFGAGYSEADRADLLSTIDEEAARLNRFVGNLLDMTRLESGALPLNRDWVSVSDLVGTAIARARPQLAGRDVALDLAPDLPLLRVDFVLMEQALFNLLDNAGKHTPPGSPLHLSARLAGSEVAIEIRDEGPGIPPADLAHVFDKFYRVRAGDRKPAGTGLGLSISRGFVEAHGGHLDVRSPAAAGRGTAFVLRLPVEAQPAEERAGA